MCVFGHFFLKKGQNNVSAISEVQEQFAMPVIAIITLANIIEYLTFNVNNNGFLSAGVTMSEMVVEQHTGQPGVTGETPLVDAIQAYRRLYGTE